MIPKILLVGIDPPKGFARRFFGEPKCHIAKTTDFVGLLDEITNLQFFASQADQGPVRVVVFLEAPYLNKSVHSGILRQGYDNGSGKLLTPVLVKKILDVGKNMGLAMGLRDHIQTMANLELVESKPNMYSRTKTSAAEVQSLGLFDGKTSEHSRDAMMLIHPANMNFVTWLKREGLS